MFYLMIIVFILGYLMIALEHPLKINKTATALMLGVLIWTIYILAGEGIYDPANFHSGFDSFKLAHPDLQNPFVEYVAGSEMLAHLGDISEILFFLIGAMTIVEVVDQHQGFTIITDHITTRDKVKLLWILGFITFFLSAVLDNLTTTLVMIALLRKLIYDQKERWFFAGIIVIAANAGGAWSPIGDVTTIMLWIGNYVTAGHLVVHTFLPSLVSLVIPLTAVSFMLKGEFEEHPLHARMTAGSPVRLPRLHRNLMFWLGIGSLLFVPVFKMMTHLKPYVGVMLGLSVVWIANDLLYRRSGDKHTKYRVAQIISRIDMSSILFFLGILLAVAGLQSAGQLSMLSGGLDKAFGDNYNAINVVIGLLSSVIDNVPLVAGAIGMYGFETNHIFWTFLAYCAGTGGSILIIGSAAGVAAMGMEKIDFIWYLKKITPLALIGYLAGAGTFILMDNLLF